MAAAPRKTVGVKIKGRAYQERFRTSTEPSATRGARHMANTKAKANKSRKAGKKSVKSTKTTKGQKSAGKRSTKGGASVKGTKGIKKGSKGSKGSKTKKGGKGGSGGTGSGGGSLDSRIVNRVRSNVYHYYEYPGDGGERGW
jgi:hypothetical protein